MTLSLMSMPVLLVIGVGAYAGCTLHSHGDPSWIWHAAINFA